MKKAKPIPCGSKRIKKNDLKLYIKKHNAWILEDDMPEHTKHIIDIYDKENSIHLLVDEKSNDFLKGYIDANGNLCGARVKYLPSNKALARGGFSIFAKNLRINEDGNLEWDICYENDSGLKTYLYSEDKIKLEKEKKAEIVDEFTKFYDIIIENVMSDIIKTNKIEYIALYTLIKTLIRVGNLEYYHHYKHKGLTTLQKSDISILDDTVIFNFIGKDGVPQTIEKKFDKWYIDALTNRLKKIHSDEFVFSDSKGNPLHSSIFSQILFKYTNKHFYPHIIRSYYADNECRKYLKQHKKATKEQINKKFDSIAKALGHKKFNRKTNKWEICHKVTIDSYIRPILSQEMIKLYK